MEGVVTGDASALSRRHRLAPIAFLRTKLQHAFEPPGVQGPILSVQRVFHQTIGTQHTQPEFVRIHFGRMRQLIHVTFQHEANHRGFYRPPPSSGHGRFRRRILQFVTAGQVGQLRTESQFRRLRSRFWIEPF